MGKPGKRVLRDKIHWIPYKLKWDSNTTTIWYKSTYSKTTIFCESISIYDICINNICVVAFLLVALFWIKNNSSNNNIKIITAMILHM